MISSLQARFTSVPGVRRVESAPSKDGGDRAAEEEASRTASTKGAQRTVTAKAIEGAQSARKGEDQKKPGRGDLTDEQKKQVQELKARDREVRAHEAAHKAAAAGLRATGPNYTYQSGPDGQRYAVGGEVNIDTSPGRTPEETVRKAEQIIRAARAPAEPSGQDQAVAAQAAAMGAQARAELAAERGEEEPGAVAPGEDGAPATAGLEGDRAAEEGKVFAREMAAYRRVRDAETASPPGTLVRRTY